LAREKPVLEHGLDGNFNHIVLTWPSVKDTGYEHIANPGSLVKAEKEERIIYEQK